MNTIKDMKCPKCGWAETFEIEVGMLVTVDRDCAYAYDTSADHDSLEWKMSSQCECRNDETVCDFEGTVADFLDADAQAETAQYTPGPWIVEYKATRGRDAVMACGEQWIATVGQSTIPTPEMAAANARLIAAAPDYHTAVQKVLDSGETLPTTMTEPERMAISIETWDALLIARDKAEGKPTC